MMVTDAGETVTLLVSPLDSDTVTPPAGAAEGRVMARAVDCPMPTFVVAGMPMVPAFTTVMLAVAFATFGVIVLAVMVAEPAATPVTGTVTLFALAAIVTVAGTVAAAVLLELRLIVTPPAGALTDKLRVRF